MKKRKLEIILQKLQGFQDPKAELEQYPTPATVASTILWKAYMAGDIKGKVVYDLGCGTGTLAIGAALLDAKKAVGIDSDPSVIDVVEGNAGSAEADVSFRVMDISDVSGDADTVVQNPPFGAQSKGSDRPFIRKSLEAAPVVYSLHMSETEDFIRQYVEKLEARIDFREKMPLPMKSSMPWHTEKVKSIDVTLFRFVRI